MMFIRYAIFLSLVLALASSTSWGHETPPVGEPVDARVEQIIRRMPLKKKIGQLFMIGFQGKSMNEGLAETLKNVSPGGLIVFGRNLESARQISNLNIEVQRESLRLTGVPLLIATDQEGGDVMRIKTEMPLPSALALGRTASESLTEAAGRATGTLLKTLGFNMNLAPVLDVADPKQPTFIGTRTYGSDPSIVSRMGVKFGEGLLEAGVLPTGKHFPGHGGINDDSHKAMPTKDVSADQLKNHDLVPFKAAHDSLRDRWAVMLAHIAYPQIDPTLTPASLSKPIVTGLLREQLGFDGIVLTDDIGMAGAYSIKNVHERVARAIEAGVDMIMVAWNRRLQAELVEGLLRAVRKGRITEERVNQSLRRILIAKARFADSHSQPPSDHSIRYAMRNPEFIKIGRSTMEARFGNKLEPGEKEFRAYAEGREIFVFATSSRFRVNFLQSIPERKTRAFALDLERPQDVTRIMLSNPRAVGVFYVSGEQVGRIAASLPDDVARRMLLVTVAAQGSLPNLASFRYVADVYFRHPSLGRMVATHYFKFKKENPEIRTPASTDEKPISDVRAERDSSPIGLRAYSAPQGD